MSDTTPGITSMSPVTDMVEITRPDGSHIVSHSPLWVAERIYTTDQGYKCREVRGVHTMHGFRILSQMGESLYLAMIHD